MIEQIFLLMWLVDIASAVSIACGVLLLVCFVAAIPLSILYFDGTSSERALGESLLKRALLIGAACALLTIAIPSKQTIYTYLALSVGVEVAEISGLSGTAAKAVQLLNKKLDEELADE